VISRTARIKSQSAVVPPNSLQSFRILPIQNSTLNYIGQFGVELHGSIQLVRDDLDVVDPLKHDRLLNFVDEIFRARLCGEPLHPQGWRENRLTAWC
jgi:hypothetical protein